MKSGKSFEELLQDLLQGEPGDDSLRQLADLLQDDQSKAALVRSELEFSELIKQGLRDGTEVGSEFQSALESGSVQMDEVIDRVCSGRPTAYECDQLAKHLWEHPAQVRSVMRRMAEDEWMAEAVAEAKGEESFVEALETRMWAETRQDHFVKDFAVRLDQEITQREGEDGNVIAMPIARTRVVLQMGAVAAAVAFGAFVLVQQLSGVLGEGADVALLVKSSGNVKWTGDIFPNSKGGVKAGKYQLESGVIALKFPTGGEMTVEGPAIFSVDEDSSAYVYHGVALAKANSPQEAISLRSRALNVSNPGLLIGLDARSEHSTDAIIFEGDGGVCLSDGGSCRSMFELDAIKADHTRDKLVDIPYNPHAFSKAWEMLSGVETNMGEVRIELPGTEIQSDTGSGEVQIFVENNSFHPKGAMEVDQLLPGQFSLANSNLGRSLNAEGDLRSYLLQLRPSEGAGDEGIEASLTFDHPVVGVIYSSDRLENSDLSVGSSIRDVGGDFGRVRGLDSESDELLLSDDGRTLNLKLRGGSTELDQVRVLVALN